MESICLYVIVVYAKTMQLYKFEPSGKSRKIKENTQELFNFLVQTAREEDIITHDLPTERGYTPACRIANCLYDSPQDEPEFAAYEACWKAGYHLKVTLFRDEGRIIYEYIPSVPIQWNLLIKAKDEEESAATELFDELQNALVNNHVDKFDVLKDKTISVLESDLLDITEKYDLLHRVKGLSKKPLHFETRVFQTGLLMRGYFVLFDSNCPFRVNVPCLEFFFESATRVGRERDDLMTYCETVFRTGMSYADAELLVDLVPVGDLKDEILEHLRSVGSTKQSQLTYHSDSQSVHNKGIVDSTLRAITFVNEIDKSADFDHMRDEFVHRIGRKNLNKAQKNALRIIGSDISNMNLKSAFCHVWSRIIDSTHKAELTNRLLEELNEMNDKCKSGHLSRLVNVLHGFEDVDFGVMKISYDDEIKAAFLARFEYRIKQLPESSRDAFLANMVDDEKTGDYVIFKETVRYELYDQLKTEYQPMFDAAFDEAAFDSAYAEAVNSV